MVGIGERINGQRLVDSDSAFMLEGHFFIPGMYKILVHSHTNKYAFIFFHDNALRRHQERVALLLID